MRAPTLGWPAGLQPRARCQCSLATAMLSAQLHGAAHWQPELSNKETVASPETCHSGAAKFRPRARSDQDSKARIKIRHEIRPRVRPTAQAGVWHRFSRGVLSADSSFAHQAGVRLSPIQDIDRSMVPGTRTQVLGYSVTRIYL